MLPKFLLQTVIVITITLSLWGLIITFSLFFDILYKIHNTNTLKYLSDSLFINIFKETNFITILFWIIDIAIISFSLLISNMLYKEISGKYNKK